MTVTATTAPRRHSVSASTGATIRYEGNSVPLQVRMLDFSPSGAGFLMPEQPETGAGIVLSITDRNESMQLAGTIKWAQPRSAGWWRVGCHFKEPVGKGFDFGNKKVVRDSCEIPVRIRCEGEGDDQHDATIVNHSEGGVCVRTATNVSPGHALLFETGEGLEPTEFVARVQWCREDGDESILGCQFTRPAGLRAFKKLLANPIPKEPAEAMSQNDRAVWIGCALTFALAALYVMEVWPL